MKRLLPILLLLLAFLLAGCSQDPAEPAETAAPAAEPASAAAEPAPAGEAPAETAAPAAPEPAAPEATLPQIIQPEPVIWLPFPRTDTSWRAVYKGEGAGEGSVHVDSKRDGFNVTGLVPGDSEITLEAPDTGETVVYQIHVDDDLNITCEPVQHTPAASGAEPSPDTGAQNTPHGRDTEMPLDTDAPGPAQTVTPGSLNP